MVDEGDMAPIFEAPALYGEKEIKLRLKDYKGYRVALYFYPKDMTYGCSIQAKNIMSNFEELEKNGVKVIGVSKDSLSSHRNFIEKKGIEFPIVSDIDGEVGDMYGVLKKKNFMGKEFFGVDRTTFLIDENLKVVKVIRKPDVRDHANEILSGFDY